MSLERATMVQSQLIPNQITHEALLVALKEIPRELFVPPSQKALAYQDASLPVTPYRFMLSVATLANLIQTAALLPQERVLDIGCGLGYSTAVLSFLTISVIGIEEDENLATQGNKNLRGIGITNAHIFHAALQEGYPDDAPYDVIFIQGSVEEIPERIRYQLSEEGGRLVTIQQEGMCKKEIILQRFGNTYSVLPQKPLQAPSLLQFFKKPPFIFN